MVEVANNRNDEEREIIFRFFLARVKLVTDFVT